MARDDDDGYVLAVGALLAIMIGVAFGAFYIINNRPSPLGFGITVENGLDGTDCNLDWFDYEIYNDTGWLGVYSGYPGYNWYMDPVEVGTSLAAIQEATVAQFSPRRCILHFNGTSNAGVVFQDRWVEIHPGPNVFHAYPEPSSTNITVRYGNSTVALSPAVVPAGEGVEVAMATSPRHTIWGCRDALDPWLGKAVWLLVSFASDVWAGDFIAYSGQDGFGIAIFQHNSTCICFEFPGISWEGVVYGLRSDPSGPSHIISRIEIWYESRIVSSW